MNYFNRVIPAILDFFLPKSQLDRAVNAVTADVLSKKLLCLLVSMAKLRNILPCLSRRVTPVMLVLISNPSIINPTLI